MGLPRVLRLAGLAVFACGAAALGHGLGGPAADAGQPDTIFGGNHSSGGIVLISYNYTTKAVSAFAADVPLGPPCEGQTQDIEVTGLELREDESFSGTTANGGIGGQFMTNIGAGIDSFVGTITSHLGAPDFECLTSGIGYDAIAGMHPLGDVDCSWLQSAGAGAQGETEPPETPVTLADAFALLKLFAGVDDPPPAGCPAPGEELPNGAKHGDVNCDEVVDQIDALDTFKAKAGAPVQQAPGCPAFGAFYSPDV